jgi:XTP/dITP diphosphohydrolase
VTRLLVATTNPGKLAEFRRLLTELGAEIVSPDDLGLPMDVPEPHTNYGDNAAAKARALAAASGLLTVADDSGIEVAALNWGPGPRSARHGGEADRSGPELLLEQLEGQSDRRARMVCALAIARPAPDTASPPAVEVFYGVVHGQLADEPRGVGGFGYDPIFLLPEGVTAAELSDAGKDARSHRGLAVASALPRLHQLLEASPFG